MGQRFPRGATMVAALLATLFTSCVLVTTPASAADGSFWACRVPEGYTYDRVEERLNECSTSGFATSYHVVKPADNIWVCRMRPGFTYDRVDSRPATCGINGFATSYHMRVPVDGMWACTIPDGFTYDRKEERAVTCSISGLGLSFHLRAY